MKKPTEVQRKWVYETIETWRGRLLLNEWFFNANYISKDLEDGKFVINASVMACPVYMKANIDIYPQFWTLNQEQRERILIHEMCHCLTQELWNAATHLGNGNLINENTIRDMAERLTQRISNTVYMGY